MNGRRSSGLWYPILVLGFPVLTWCLCGCATTDDPHQGGFVSGVVGLTSGGYEKRISAREHSYETELGEQQRLIAEADALRRERARVQADLNQANRRLASIEQKVRQARSQIARERRTSGSVQQQQRRLDATEAKIAEVRSTLDETRPGEQPVSLLAVRSREINKELDEIDTLVAVVAGSGI
jgi:tetrahydromethanopterin S-methyltransferase subunit G